MQKTIPLAALGEFIGKKVRVAASSCKGVQGIEGTVLDETANTFVLETRRGRKRILKKGSVFLFEGEEVPGSLLIHRPEDRTKKLARLMR
ncbi:MAG: ribonuclease P protein subunit [Candidatus Micrarchaeota archaeon]|nr:ribonuclease P protein subunit [Candidatus Micrarchaeota archaeon]